IRGNKNVLKAKVQLKNAGTETLIIKEVKATCGCTTAPLDKKELGPGEIGTLDITLRVAGRSNNVSKTIRIMSNDKNTPEKVLWLKCQVIRDLQISQSYLAFQEMTVGNNKEAKISIKNNSKDLIKLSDFVIEPAELKINLKGIVNIKPGQQIDLIGTVTPNQPGNFRGSVKFKTTNKDNKEVTINAFGRVKKSPIFNNPK
ncbi:DUF1573 domain-containing protein, partial [Bacteroidota bacterium]